MMSAQRRGGRKPSKSAKGSAVKESAGSEEVVSGHVASARLIVTSQQSRFHTETVETLSKEVDIHDLNIHYDGLPPLLAGAHLKLETGVHYGLVGRNGCGKSTLLKTIAQGYIAALPSNIRVLYIEQIADDLESNCVVLDEVFAADVKLCKLIDEREMLQRALDDEDLDAVVETMHRLKIADLEDELATADARATARSGKRGYIARQELLKAESRLASAVTSTNDPSKEEDQRKEPATLESIERLSRKDAVRLAQQRLADVCTRIAASGGDTREGRAIKILESMGFIEGKKHTPSSKVSELSGGWKMRVALAKALFLEPDILLLDEPTNHLDLPAIIWLRKYIKSIEDMTIVTISHDRGFLDFVTEEIIVLKDRTLTYHTGNYEEYVVNTNNKQLMKRRMISAQEKQKEHVNATIANALKRGDTALAATRKKKLERFGLQKSAKGTRFKLNRDLVGYFTTMRAEITLDTTEPPAKITLDPPASLRHKGTSLVSVEAVSAGHGRSGQNVLNGVTLNVDLGDRIVVVGSNGSGKSTLMDVIVGKLEPRSGRVQRHPNARIGYFAQRHVDELSHLTKTAVEYLSDEFSVPANKAKSVDEIFELKPQDCYERFGRVGLPIAVAAGQPLKTLSGGERTRVVLAYAFYGAPQLIVLDEVTNHLDMESIEALLDALEDWEGAVVLVTHNEYFAREVLAKRRMHADEDDSEDDEEEEEVAEGTQIASRRRLFHLVGGRLEELSGGVDEYVSLMEKRSKKKRN